MLRFIHSADIHLDSPLKGLERYEGAPVDEIRGATRRALENLVELASGRKVDFVLIAGDLYDGDWKDHNTGLYFVRQMHRLRDEGIPVVLISGNHDAANRMTRELQLPDNVEVLPHTEAGTARMARLADLGVAIHGRSFANPAEYENFAQGYLRKQPGLFNIGMLHTSLDGAEGHEPYAPCVLDDLRQKEYQYWALGHVHTRQVRGEDPPIVYPGNIQGRHIREAGAKGCYVVTADEQMHCSLEFVSLDVFRWETCRLEVSGVRRPESVRDQLSDELTRLGMQHEGIPLGVRIEVTGATEIHERLRSDSVRWLNEFRSATLAQRNQRIWIEKVRWNTTPRRELPASDPSGPIGVLSGYLQELRDDPELLIGLAEVLGDLKRKLPDELFSDGDALRFDDPVRLRQWLDEVEPLLLGHLREGVDP
jgi:DNA repair exonuclease SbcCD nuclease subunit